MLGSHPSGGTASRNLAASGSYLRSAPLYLLGLFVIGGAMLAVVTSASARQSAFPGRNGRILLDMHCKAGAAANSGSCGERYVMMNADGSSLRILRPVRWYGARWSPDGQRILVARGDLFPTSISVLKPAGGPVTVIWDRQRAKRTGLSVSNPDWLSAKRIVFLGKKGGGAWTGIYTMALDGTRLRKLRVFSGFVGGVRASPDGRRIAFGRHPSGRPIPTDDLYVMNADGSGLRLLRKRCSLVATDWSPDGKRLLVISAATREGPVPECVLDYDLELMSVKNGAVTHLLTEKYVVTGPGQSYGGEFRAPSFSPDGTRIAFLVDRQPNGSRTTNTVMVMNSNGTGLRKVHQGETRVGQDPNGEVFCIRCVGYWSIAWQPLRR
jgi:Tol biopolymer transport system component